MKKVGKVVMKKEKFNSFSLDLQDGENHVWCIIFEYFKNRHSSSTVRKLTYCCMCLSWKIRHNPSSSVTNTHVMVRHLNRTHLIMTDSQNIMTIVLEDNSRLKKCEILKMRTCVKIYKDILLIGLNDEPRTRTIVEPHRWWKQKCKWRKTKPGSEFPWSEFFFSRKILWGARWDVLAADLDFNAPLT